MVPDDIIDAFPRGMLVMHPSLLPKYRGACPIQHAILNQEAFTGTSVIEISKGVFDAGNIMAQSSQVPITRDTSFKNLSVQLSELGGELLADILKTGDDSLQNFRAQSRSQDEGGHEVTYAPMIPAEFGELSFRDLTS